MWPDIIVSISLSLAESLYGRILSSKRKKELGKSLEVIFDHNMNRFVDSTLDTNEFYIFTKSIRFKELFRNVFFSISDNVGSKELKKNICKEMKQRCPSANEIDIKHFYEQICTLFRKEINDLIHESIDLQIVLSLLTASRREIIQKISDSEEELKKYLSAISARNVSIKDKVINDYHLICELEYSLINFSGISGAETKRQRNINDLYVENTFSFYIKDRIFTFPEKMEPEQCALPLILIGDLFKFGNKVVILGGAGYGKTTTVNYIFCNYEKIFKKKHLRFKICLKEYATQIASKEQDIIDCLCKEFAHHVQYSNDYDLKNVIADYLGHGLCFIVFDALDEIPSQALRDSVRNEVANFCSIYYLNKFIVTSREVGYLRNQFTDSFVHYRINPFSETEIEEYSAKWFAINAPQEDVVSLREKFQKEIIKSKCDKLVSNPIILILALIVFATQEKLPHRRVEFYKKCIDTFLVSREERKEAFALSNNARNILGDDLVIPKVAFKQFDRLQNDADYKLSKSELLKFILSAIEVPDERNWIDPVKQYFDYLVNRTELIREIDEDRFDFSHKTFGEYFLSQYFVKGIKNEELIMNLDKWIGDSNLDELARLVLEVIIKENNAEQHKLIINHMFKKINEYARICNSSLLELEYDSNKEKAIDYSNMLIHLFINGMLQAKFQRDYHMMAIRYPWLFNLYRRTKNKPINYDECLDLINNLKENDISLDEALLNMIYFRNASPLRHEDLSNIYNDYNYIKHFEREKWDMSNHYNRIKYYFDNIELVNSSGIAYMILVVLLSKSPDLLYENSNLEILLSAQLHPSNIFMIVVSPLNYMRFLKISFDSPEWFVLFIKTIITFNTFDTLYILRYADNANSFGSYVKNNLSKGDIEICIHNAKRIQKFLCCNCIESFVESLKREGIFNDSYYTYYQEIFSQYQKYEPDLEE